MDSGKNSNWQFSLTSTTTTLTSSLNPSTFGSGVTFTATVSPSGATGTFTFKDGSTTIGTTTVGQGSGKLLISTLGAGSHSLTVVYGGDSNYLTSTSSALTQTVNKADTISTVASSLNPSTYGANVTLTGTVAPSSATGTLTFKEGSTTLGTATLGHGSGTLAISTLSVGSHSLTVVYAGNSNYNTSTSSTLTQTVNQASTTTTLTSSLNPSTFGSGVTFTATVSPSAATGTFTFKDGSTTIGTATVGHGSGTLVTSTLGAGSHSLTAVYGGDSNYLTSTSSAVTQTVNKADAISTLASSLNPSTYGASITLTGTVAPSSATGTLTFKEGATTLGTATLGHGSGTLSLSTLSVGSHSLTVVYAGNSNFSTSTSSTLTQTVNAASTTTTLTSSLNPSTFGSGVMLTATVSPSGATGTFTFKDGSTTIGTATVGHGSGTLLTHLGPGNHSLTAAYGGDTSYAASTSSTLTQVMNSGNIFGSAFVDSNGNGTKDSDETTIFANTALQLLGTTATGGTLNVTTVTSSTGAYQFSRLPMSSGSYLLVITPPSGYTATTTDSRSDVVASSSLSHEEDFGYLAPASGGGAAAHAAEQRRGAATTTSPGGTSTETPEDLSIVPQMEPTIAARPPIVIEIQPVNAIAEQPLPSKVVSKQVLEPQPVAAVRPTITQVPVQPVVNIATHIVQRNAERQQAEQTVNQVIATWVSPQHAPVVLPSPQQPSQAPSVVTEVSHVAGNVLETLRATAGLAAKNVADGYLALREGVGILQDIVTTTGGDVYTRIRDDIAFGATQLQQRIRSIASGTMSSIHQLASRSGLPRPRSRCRRSLPLRPSYTERS